jgi:hypothetical protein
MCSYTVVFLLLTKDAILYEGLWYFMRMILEDWSCGAGNRPSDWACSSQLSDHVFSFWLNCCFAFCVLLYLKGNGSF